MARIRKLSNNKRRQVNLLVDQAVAALNQKHYDLCDSLCRRLNEMDPDNADSASICGIVATHMGNPKQAMELFKQAIKAAPKRCEFHMNLAGLYLMQGHLEAALESYRLAMQLKPYQLEIQLGYVSVLIALARYAEALAMMEAAHKRQPQSGAVLLKLFRINYELGFVVEAERWVKKLLTMDADDAEAHYSYAMLLAENGDKQQSECEVKEALRLNPADSNAALLLSELKTYAQHDADVDLIASMYKNAKEASEDRIKLAFAYGKVLDDLGEYEAAFCCFEEANGAREQTERYDLDQELAHLQMMMQAYTAPVVNQQVGVADSSPLFIVGMPRCGSTLVEQILSSHPDVTARGECDFFEEALSLSSSKEEPLTVEAMAAYQSEQWQMLGRNYLDLLQGDSEVVTHYTDKTLSNIRLIGAIHCALPNARIIHVRRHPLDTCLSIYKHNILGARFAYGRSLGQMGYYYRMYQQLMQHWRNVLPAGVLYEMDYETLIADQEQQTRLLLDAAGLPWSDACLNFYETGGAVRTASFMQVRHPMSSASIGLWKHYENKLQVLVKILGIAE
ncbi:MAG: sulfotransferase [Mariprofundaceae bacterium]|nr:sulfotransferase [Mariprofundaceae bacterium]